MLQDHGFVTTRTSDVRSVSRRTKTWAEFKLCPRHLAFLCLLEMLARQLAGTAGVLYRKVTPSSVQSCDPILISTGSLFHQANDLK